jgi:hypothetical protein
MLDNKNSPCHEGLLNLIPINTKVRLLQVQVNFDPFLNGLGAG